MGDKSISALLRSNVAFSIERKIFLFQVKAGFNDNDGHLL